MLASGLVRLDLPTSTELEDSDEFISQARLTYWLFKQIFERQHSSTVIGIFRSSVLYVLVKGKVFWSIQKF